MTKKEALNFLKKLVKRVDECEVNEGFVEGNYKKILLYLSQEYFEVFSIIQNLIKEQEKEIKRLNSQIRKIRR